MSSPPCRVTRIQSFNLRQDQRIEPDFPVLIRVSAFSECRTIHPEHSKHWAVTGGQSAWPASIAL